MALSGSAEFQEGFGSGRCGARRRRAAGGITGWFEILARKLGRTQAKGCHVEPPMRTGSGRGRRFPSSRSLRRSRFFAALAFL